MTACSQGKKNDNNVRGGEDLLPELPEVEALFTDSDIDTALGEPNPGEEIIELIPEEDEESSDDFWFEDEIESNNLSTNKASNGSSSGGSAKLETQSVTDGYLVHTYQDTSSPTEPYQIWRHSYGSGNVPVKVYGGIREVDSVGVSLDGDLVIASMSREDSSDGNKEVIAFRISNIEIISTTFTLEDEIDKTNVSMSGDGRVWVWEGTYQGFQATYIRENDGSGNQMNYVLKKEYDQIQPTVTQNGKVIVFVRQYVRDGENAWKVYGYSRATNKFHSLMASVDELGDPSLNDDGSVLGVQSKSSSNVYRVGLYDRLSQSWSWLSDSGTPTTHPYVSADGEYVTYGKEVEGEMRLYTEDLRFGTKEESPAASGNYGGMSWQRPSTLPHDAGLGADPALGGITDFGAVPVGEASSPQTIVLNETRTSELKVSYRVSGANRDDFSVSPESPFTISSGGSKNLSVTCTPSVIGERVAMLHIFSTDLQNLKSSYNLLCVGGGPSSPIIYVKKTATGSNNGSSWANAFKSLQDALAAWNPAVHTAIWVAKDVYYPDEGNGVIVTGRVASFNLKAGMKIYGGFAGGETSLNARNVSTNVTVLSGDIDNNDNNKDSNGVTPTVGDIQGDNSYHVVFADGTSTPITSATVLDGFTITGGLADDISSPQDSGGGMYCNGAGSGSDCSPTIANVSFTGNQAERGGAMYNTAFNSGSSSPTLTKVSFTGNDARSGGAIFNNSSNGGSSSPTLTNISFIGNHAQAGGAMFNFCDGSNSSSSPTLINVTFAGNQAARGGAMYNNGQLSGSSSPILTNVTFVGNKAVDKGGAMLNSGDGNTLFVSRGGESSPILTNVTFAGNHAGNGGAMYNDGNYFTGNFQTGSSNPKIQNTIFWGNKATNSGSEIFNDSANPIITDSLFQFAAPSGLGNVTSASSPFIADPSPAPSTDGNLQLRSCSKAIDAGANIVNNELYDLAGNTRKFDDNGVIDVIIVGQTQPVIDMGAYERQSHSSSCGSPSPIG